MGSMAVDLLCAGKSNRVVGFKHGEFCDFDIDDALAMQKNISNYMIEVEMCIRDRPYSDSGGYDSRRTVSGSPMASGR